MSNRMQICTVLNHIDEREAFWTAVGVPPRTDGPKYLPTTVGVGDTEAAAIADFERRTGLDGVTVEITHRDNVNIEIHEGGDQA